EGRRHLCVGKHRRRQQHEQGGSDGSRRSHVAPIVWRLSRSVHMRAMSAVGTRPCSAPSPPCKRQTICDGLVESALGRCNYVLVLLAAGWVTSAHAKVRRRCSPPRRMCAPAALRPPPPAGRGRAWVQRRVTTGSWTVIA